MSLFRQRTARLTPNSKYESLDHGGVIRFPDDVHALVLLLHLLQHQVALSVDVIAWSQTLVRLHHLVLLHHLTRLHQNHLIK